MTDTLTQRARDVAGRNYSANPASRNQRIRTMDEPITIIDHRGVHSQNLNIAVREQQLFKEGRFRELDKHNSIFVFGS